MAEPLPDTDVPSADAVADLIAAQCPQWAHHSLVPVPSQGTDHRLFRLGSELLVRLPNHPLAAPQVRKEAKWLPHLQDLPLTIPMPRFLGQGGEGCPYAWAVYDWIEGVQPEADALANDTGAAVKLAQFFKALHRLDASMGPQAGEHNNHRGMPLQGRDGMVQQALQATIGLGVNTAHAKLLWDDCLDVAVWKGRPSWVHCDVQSGNVVMRDGVVSAVIDFGLLGVGDPAVDLAVAWTVFEIEPRIKFRQVLQDAYPGFDALWMRAKGWALSIALIQLPYYAGKSVFMEAMARRTLARLLNTS